MDDYRMNIRNECDESVIDPFNSKHRSIALGFQMFLRKKISMRTCGFRKTLRKNRFVDRFIVWSHFIDQTMKIFRSLGSNCEDILLIDRTNRLILIINLFWFLYDAIDIVILLTNSVSISSIISSVSISFLNYF